MSTLKNLILILSLMLSPLAATAADTASTARLITVSGEAEICVAPDEVALTLGMESDDKELIAAKSKNDKVIEAVIKLATETGVPAKSIQTDYINIEPRWNWVDEKREFTGYFVRKSVTITLRDLSKFEALLSGVLSAGVTHVHGIEFRTTELRKHRDAARLLAIKAAKEKADALAGALDQKVGKPQSISETGNWWSGAYNNWWGAASGAYTAQNVMQDMGGPAMPAEGTLAPGQISVKAGVNVTFELQ